MKKLPNKRVAILTGASGGLGSAIASYLCEWGELYLILCCRDVKKAQILNDKLKLSGFSADSYEITYVDISSDESIKEFIQYIKSHSMQISLLINNAGAMFRNYNLSSDGYEMNMATNLLGSMRLTLGLNCSLSKGANVINILSLARNYVKLEGDFLRGSKSNYTQIKYYSRSKLALTIFTQILSELSISKGIYVNGVDPGVINTNMLSLGRWYDPIADIFFRPFTLDALKASEGVKSAIINKRKLSGHIFTRKKVFEIENRNVDKDSRRRIIELMNSLGGL